MNQPSALSTVAGVSNVKRRTAAAKASLSNVKRRAAAAKASLKRKTKKASRKFFWLAEKVVHSPRFTDLSKKCFGETDRCDCSQQHARGCGVLAVSTF